MTRHIDGQVHAAIERLAEKGWTAARIHRFLEERPELEGRMPSVRTIQRMVRAGGGIETPALAEPWQITDSQDGDSRFVLPLIASEAFRTRGMNVGVSKRRAQLIVEIRRAWPEMPPEHALDLSWLGEFLVERDISTVPLELYLGSEPWLSDAHAQRYWQGLVDWGLDAIAGEFRVLVIPPNLRNPSADEAMREVQKVFAERRLTAMVVCPGVDDGEPQEVFE